MKKEEVLKASRKENKNKDFASIEIENKAVKIAALATVILACVYYCAGIFITGESNYGWYSIIALYCSVVYGYKGIKSKNKFEIFCGVIWLIVAILGTYSYIDKLIETSEII